MCPNVKMIPPGSLDYRHPSDFVMHFPGKGQGLALPAGNTGMLCLEHPCSVTQDLLAKPSTWESSGTTSPQAHPVGRTRISLRCAPYQDPAQVLVTAGDSSLGRRFWGSRPRLPLGLLLSTPAAQQRRR